jgi:uncharacterized membrane protein
MHGVSLRSLLVLAAAATPAAAQNECLKDYRMPAMGRWSEYQATLNGKPTTMRYAVVGEESRDGAPMRWLEMRMVGDKDTSVYQMLTPGNPGEMDKIQEVVFKTGGRPAMKMSGAMISMIRGQMGKNSALANLCEGVSLVGEESVTVPAGTFKATRFHNDKQDSDAWMVKDQPFYLVKSVGKSHEIALVKSGDGATSSITEEAQDMMGGPSK